MAGGLHVAFSPPRNGWMTLEIGDGESQCEIACSHVLNDFLRDLLGALSLALQGVDGQAVAYSEPVTFEFTISPGEGDATFRIVEFPDWNRRSKEGRIVFEFREGVRSFVLRFCRALRRLESACPPEVYRQAMGYAFPAEKLQSLFERARGEDFGMGANA